MRYTAVAPRLPVADITRTIAFYRDLLAFEIDVSWPEDVPSFVVLTRDGISVSFFLLDEHRAGSIGYAEIYFEVDDAMALHEAIRSRVAVEWGPEVYSYGRCEFAVRDPDSYLLIFSTPTLDSPTIDEP